MNHFLFWHIDQRKVIYERVLFYPHVIHQKDFNYLLITPRSIPFKPLHCQLFFWQIVLQKVKCFLIDDNLQLMRKLWRSTSYKISFYTGCATYFGCLGRPLFPHIDLKRYKYRSCRISWIQSNSYPCNKLFQPTRAKTK